MSAYGGFGTVASLSSNVNTAAKGNAGFSKSGGGGGMPSLGGGSGGGGGGGGDGGLWAPGYRSGAFGGGMQQVSPVGVGAYTGPGSGGMATDANLMAKLLQMMGGLGLIQNQRQNQAAVQSALGGAPVQRGGAQQGGLPYPDIITNTPYNWDAAGPNYGPEGYGQGYDPDNMVYG